MAYVALGLALITLCLLLIFRLGTYRLESILGRAGDGLKVGSKAPVWRLPDLDGIVRGVPNSEKWQLIVFTDDSIVEFPGLVDGMRRLEATGELEAIVVTRVEGERMAKLIGEIGFDTPVVRVDDLFYWRYNVFVTPYVTIVDPTRVVQQRGVVNREVTLLKMWEVARVRERDYSNLPVGASR